MGSLFGAREKVLYQREGFLGRLDHGRMTRSVEDHDLGPGHALVELSALRRDKRILRAEDHEERRDRIQRRKALDPGLFGLICHAVVMRRAKRRIGRGINASRVPRLKVVSGFGGEPISTSRLIREGSASTSAVATSPPIE